MKAIDFIVCDDVRHETGNKISLMGIYHGEININVNAPLTKSVPIRLGIFIRLLAEGADKMPDRFEISIQSDENPLAHMEGNAANIEHQRFLQFALVASPLPISGSTHLEIVARFYNGDDLLLSETLTDGLAVNVNEPTTPSG